MSAAPAQPDLGSVQKGLRMAKPPDPSALAAERQLLASAEHAPFLARARTYLRLIGPGYMQSAMTLGAGTASAALFAGAAYGYELLWVAPLAMLLGIVMLAAVAHQTLSTGERPMHAMATHAGRFFAGAWAIGSLVASVVWHLPQYNLAANAMVDACDAVGIGGVPPMACSLVVLCIAIALSMLYGRSPKLVRAYERILKWMVWAIVFSLLWVVLSTDTDWGAVLRGFVPGIPQQRGTTDAYELIASGLAAAVGVNMVFLFPYSLLARGWGREHRRLARWDLGLGMLVPYVLSTGLMAIAAANTIHRSGTAITQKAAVADCARVLGDVMGPLAGRLVFDLGMLSMAISTITLHMLVCSFVAMEFFGCELGSRKQRLWSLLPAPGCLAPLVWGEYAVWLAVPTSVFCGLLLPVTWLGFLVLQGKRAYLGADTPRGLAGIAWRVAMLVVTLGLFAFLAWTALNSVPRYLESFTTGD